MSSETTRSKVIEITDFGVGRRDCDDVLHVVSDREAMVFVHDPVRQQGCAALAPRYGVTAELKGLVAHVLNFMTGASHAGCVLKIVGG
ncbi:MAG: hypothetical protein HY075_12655, partial [Deltaproteobacteria bacterium]|nr:hypothetical protein [Deltaproteobacteria bacterium]